LGCRNAASASVLRVSKSFKLTDLEGALDVVRGPYQDESDAAQAPADFAEKLLFITSLAVRPSGPSWKADRFCEP
jgi:hypothetical protein